MATFKDLEPLTYFGAHDKLLAVGWLGTECDFETGTVSTEFVERTKELLRDPFQPFIFAGPHACELCQFDRPMGFANLFVPGDGFLYVMPELAVHYMAAHHYKPPDGFREALLQCPDMGTQAYRIAFLDNGGRSFMSKSSFHA